MTVYTFTACTVETWDAAQTCRTQFADGASVTAAPEDTDSYRATARTLGYGADTWSQCWQHEVLHTWLACRIGLRYSPTLRLVALGRNGGQADMQANEENLVLGLQGLLNGVRVFGWEWIEAVWVDEARTFLNEGDGNANQ